MKDNIPLMFDWGDPVSLRSFAADVAGCLCDAYVSLVHPDIDVPSVRDVTPTLLCFGIEVCQLGDDDATVQRLRSGSATREDLIRLHELASEFISELDSSPNGAASFGSRTRRAPAESVSHPTGALGYANTRQA